MVSIGAVGHRAELRITLASVTTGSCRIGTTRSDLTEGQHPDVPFTVLKLRGRAFVVNAPVAASNWYQTLTCGSSNNQITEKLEDLNAPDDNATVESRWCQLRNVIQSTAMEVLGHAHRQHQDSFDDNDAAISILLPEKNGLQQVHMDLRTDATKASFFRCRCLVQQRLREMQDAWMI
ncbi:unnamed protein product, partial [Schistocephalus solidus]|uniref:Uncharacterized protein n=1 Tax=Schistocephalus solidus TaxID=70667 RepID=A0A183SID1_SCHSO